MRLLQLTLCGAGLLAANLPLAAPSSYLLRYKFHAGQVDRYAIRFTMRAVPRSANAQGGGVPPNPGSATSTLKVLRVNKDGSAQVAASVEGLRTAAAGETTSPPEVITYTLSPEGRVSNVKTRPGSTVTMPGGGLFDPAALTRISAILPPRPVKPGERWSAVMPSPLRGGKPVRVAGLLISVGKMAGQTTAKVKEFVTFPLAISIGQAGGAGSAGIAGSLALTSVTDFGIEAGKALAGTVDGGGVLTIKQAGTARNPGAMALDLKVHADLRLIR